MTLARVSALVVTMASFVSVLAFALALIVSVRP